ncbi:MAG: hypothetical protein H7311_07315 [Ramlibacter sp.]|nr:hypothetical protein [Cryobacterium sp.]
MTEISTELREALLREMRSTLRSTTDRKAPGERPVLVLELGSPVYDEVETLLGNGAGRASRGDHAITPDARAVLIVEPVHPVYDEVEFLIGNDAERVSLGAVARAMFDYQAGALTRAQVEEHSPTVDVRPVHSVTKNRTAIDVRLLVFGDDDCTEFTGEALHRRTLVDAVPRAGESFVPGQLTGFSAQRTVVHHVEHAPFAQYSDEPTVGVVLHLCAVAESDSWRRERQGRLRADGWQALAART